MALDYFGHVKIFFDVHIFGGLKPIPCVGCGLFWQGLRHSTAELE